MSLMRDNHLRRKLTCAFPIHDQPAQQVVLAEEGHGQQRSIADPNEDLSDPTLVDAFVGDVADLHWLARHRQPPECAFSLHDGHRA